MPGRYLYGGSLVAEIPSQVEGMTLISHAFVFGVGLKILYKCDCCNVSVESYYLKKHQELCPCNDATIEWEN
jgi:hypothetical protein